MKVVAVIGAVGGAGATTVAAHLATALSLQQREALCFDWCAENRLRLHFGMALADDGGWASSLLDGSDWHAAAYRCSSGVDFVPFGNIDGDGQLEQLTAWLKGEPDWFSTQLSLLRIPSETIVVCDCPRLPAALRDQVLSTADIVLVISTSDTVSYATSTRMAAGAAQTAKQTMLVLNGFDSSRQLDRDIAVLLRTQHKAHFAPVVVHRDESVREAVACKQTVFDFAPSCQAAYDFSALATWTLARLGHEHGLETTA